MDSMTKIISKTFVKDLLIIDALQNTDRENPKTAREIIIEVGRKLNENFSVDFPKSDVELLKNKPILPIVSRIVNDMNLLPELYKIETYRDKKLGYYNANEGKNFLFTPVEFALIVFALYRMLSISS